MTPEEIRDWRLARDWTQVDLARALGLPNPGAGGYVTVARWERGVASPPAYLVRALRDIERDKTRRPA